MKDTAREELKKVLTTWYAEVTGMTNVNFVADMQVENLIQELAAWNSARTDTVLKELLAEIRDVVGEDEEMRPYPKGANSTASTDLDNGNRQLRNDLRSKIRTQIINIINKRIIK